MKHRPRSLPKLLGLRAFEATARLGGVSRAATELSLTQAAVSRQLQAQDFLGCAESASHASWALQTLPSGVSLPESEPHHEADIDEISGHVVAGPDITVPFGDYADLGELIAEHRTDAEVARNAVSHGAPA
jgi:hypothetical protein